MTYNSLPLGFFASGLHCGIAKKPEKKDLALFYSRTPCRAAALFTTNRVQAAPVLVSKTHIKTGRTRALIANSGCANACTGKRGLSDAEEMCRTTARTLRISTNEVLVASTGVIGQFLPMNRVKGGIQQLSDRVLANSSDPLSAVCAIMTTDTFPKIAATKFRIGNRTATLWGCAKGSGMIHPDLATMFSFILTDAALPQSAMRRILKSSADETFNALTVDGDTSTNDCVFFLANGLSVSLKQENEIAKFEAEFRKVCRSLAEMMARDGEGATKKIEIRVRGARTARQAHQVAKTVATSPLVKTAFFGEDANWGRIMAAIGRSGVPIDPKKIDIFFGDLQAARNGCPIHFSEHKAKMILKKKEIAVRIDLHQGKSSAKYWTCDLSLDYVKINADYRS